MIKTNCHHYHYSIIIIVDVNVRSKKKSFDLIDGNFSLDNNLNNDEINSLNLIILDEKKNSLELN